MYASKFGRFSTPDNFLNDTKTNVPSSWNLYVFVLNNPINNVDPTGETVDVSRLDEKEREDVIRRLNYTYGCNNCVSVNKNNELRVDTSMVDSKVLKAATFLTDAINKDKLAFVLDVTNNNIKFAFGRSTIGGAELSIPGSNNKRSAVLIELDFDDDKWVTSGDDNAKESFLNTVLAHEIAHFSPEFEEDPKNTTERGHPVNAVNEILFERNLPLRGNYIGSGANSAFYKIPFGSAAIDKRQAKKGKDGIIVNNEPRKIVSWPKNRVGGKGIN